MTNPYHLVRDYISHDAADAFLQLAHGAANGDVVGGAVVVFMRGRRYAVNVYGTARRNATLARGAVAVLDDMLSDMIRERDSDETR